MSFERLRIRFSINYSPSRTTLYFLIKNKTIQRLVLLTNKKNISTQEQSSINELESSELVDHIGEGTRGQIIEFHNRGFGLEGKSSSLDLSSASSACAD